MGSFRFFSCFFSNMVSGHNSPPRGDEPLPSSGFSTGPDTTVYRLNTYLDGFFYSGGSALDILARELLAYFDLVAPANVYYRTARDEISKHKSGDPILTLLNVPDWKREFTEYRNAATHELLILDQISQKKCLEAGTLRLKVGSIPLPDDPRLDQDKRTYRKHKDVSKYSEKTFENLLVLISKIYGHLIKRIGAKGSLPL